MHPSTCKRALDFICRRSLFPYSKSSDEKGFVFIHIPKTAGTSIRVALNEPEKGRLHLPWWVYEKANKGKFERYFKFAFVRDPIERVFSAYHYLKLGGNKLDDIEVSNIVNGYSSFEEFFESEIVNGFMGEHPLFRPQSWYVYDWSGKLRVDFLGEYKCIDRDFEFISKKLKIKSSLPIVNLSGCKFGSVEVSDRCLDSVKKYYRRDYYMIGEMKR